MKHKGGQLMKLPDGKKIKPLFHYCQVSISRGWFHLWFVPQTVWLWLIIAIRADDYEKTLSYEVYC